MKPDGFTRRSFIRLSTATIMGTALGMTSTTLVGCSDDSSSNTDASASQSIDTQDAIKLHVSDRSFSVDEGPEVAMSTDILSLIPVVASNTIEAAYVDENGEWQREPLGDLGSAIVVHGTLGMLTADGTKGEGSVIVADDADISVLSIGTIERADVEGKVGCLVVLGPADATAQSGASLDHVVVNSRTGIIEKVKDATVGSIHAPKGTDATGEVIESVLQPITAEDEFALTVNGSCLAAYGDSSNENDNEWRANFGEDTTSESTQSNDTSASAASFIGSLFAPKTAYADEAEGELQPVDDNSDDADSDADATDNSDPDTDDPSSDDPSSDDQDSKPGDPNDPPVDVEYVEPDDPNAEYTPADDAVAGDGSDYSPATDDPDAGIPDDAAVPVPYPGLERVDPEAAGANIGEDIAIKLLGKALKGVAKWAGEEIASYAGDKVLDLVYGAVFGDETSEELAKIEAKLEEIEAKLEQIEQAMSKILNQLQKMTFAEQVNTYISSYYTNIKTWLDTLDGAADRLVDQKPQEQRLAAAKTLAEALLTDDQYKSGPLNMRVDEAAVTLANKILEPWAGTNSNVIGAYDNLMVYTYKWEHQGYADRCDFQEMLISQFLRLVGYAQIALRESITETKGDPKRETEYALSCSRFQLLFGDQSIIQDYAAQNGSAKATPLVDQISNYMDNYSCPALARDASQRYYQVPDHPMLFAANGVTVWTWYKDEDQRCTMYDTNDHHVPTIDQYKAILKDYQGSDTPYLDQIFFSEDEGAFGKPEEDVGYRHIGFEYPLPYDKSWLGDEVDQYVPVIETNGKTWNCRVTHKYWDFAGWHLKVDKVSFNCVYLLK